MSEIGGSSSSSASGMMTAGQQAEAAQSQDSREGSKPKSSKAVSKLDLTIIVKGPAIQNTMQEDIVTYIKNYVGTDCVLESSDIPNSAAKALVLDSRSSVERILGLRNPSISFSPVEFVLGKKYFDDMKAKMAGGKQVD